MDRAIQIIIAHGELYVDRSIDRVVAANVPLYVNMPRHILRSLVGQALTMVMNDAANGTTTYSTHLRNIGVARAKSGAPISEMIRGLEHGFQVISDDLRDVFGDDLAPRLWWESQKHNISYAGMLSVNEAYYQAREELIAEQNREILSLSAPVLPLAEGILVLPIVGSLNDQRAALILQTLLDSIIKHASEVVILDVTGMHTIDTSVTEHLLNAASAARLLGAQVLLVGIRSEVAMALTRGSAPLGDVTTLADLMQGLSYALRLRRNGRRS